MIDFDVLFNNHINLSFKRLTERDYQIDNLFQSSSYDWQGDWEGRALLAFCNLYLLTGKQTPALSKFFEYYKKHANSDGFLGDLFNQNEINEQQLSGHSWLLCGLCSYYKIFNDKIALNCATDVVYNLFIHLKDYISSYPIIRTNINKGGVSGNIEGVVDRWKISSDVGCAFISIDGLSEYYSITLDKNVKNLLDLMIDKFLSIDKLSLKVQTHATLSATRGILRLYQSTLDYKYLDIVKRLFDLYLINGLTYTFENFNWFNRFDTWTEPCAVTDSLIISTTLYNITKQDEYLSLARKIWFNGLNFCHRFNGGAGPDSCVYKDNNILKISMFEAPFCCNMRFVSALTCIRENYSLFNYNSDIISVDDLGRHFVGDILTVKDSDGNISLITDLAFSENDKKEYKVIY